MLCLGSGRSYVSGELVALACNGLYRNCEVHIQWQNLRVVMDNNGSNTLQLM